jgi:hypothetical protein
MQYRSRYYDAALGRFLVQDSFRGNKLIPPSLHRYVYVVNNPVRYTDPTGYALDFTPWEACLFEILGLLGALPAFGLVTSVFLDVLSLIAIILFILWPTGENSPDKYVGTAILATMYAISILAAILLLTIGFGTVWRARMVWAIAVAQLILYELVVYYAFGTLNPIANCMKLTKP